MNIITEGLLQDCVMIKIRPRTSLSFIYGYFEQITIDSISAETSLYIITLTQAVII